MNCREAGEMFSPSLDGQLTRKEEAELQEHLKKCSVCRQEWAEWVEWEQVAETLRQQSQVEIEAPVGFSAAVMARIESENVRPARVNWKGWKPAAIGTAAALLLAAGSLAVKTDHFVQVADRDKQVNQVQNSQANTGKTDKAGEPGAAISGANAPGLGFQQPGGKFTAPDKPTASGSSFTLPSTAELTGENHMIISTLLKVKVAEVQPAEAAAINMAQAFGASVQSLGQQSEGGVVYLVDSIVVDEARAQQLIQKLTSLGNTVAKQEQKEDVTKRYIDMNNQLIALKNQRAQAQDSEQAVGLDRQISQIEAQLHNWDKQTSKQTIVLWLQQ